MLSPTSMAKNCIIRGSSGIKTIARNLLEIRTAYRARKKDALICVDCAKPLRLVEPRERAQNNEYRGHGNLSKRKPKARHLAHYADRQCSRRLKGVSIEHHLRIQKELVEIGKKLGEDDACIELTLPGGIGRIDVAWPKSGIAWEIDLSPQSPSNQLNRAERRHACGWRMFSLVGCMFDNRARSNIPTVWAKEIDEKEKTYPLEGRFVYRIRRLGSCGQVLEQVNGVKFVEFIKSVLSGNLVYRFFKSENSFYWVGKDVLDTHLRCEELRRKIDAVRAKQLESDKEGSRLEKEGEVLSDQARQLNETIIYIRRELDIISNLSSQIEEKSTDSSAHSALLALIESNHADLPSSELRQQAQSCIDTFSKPKLLERLFSFEIPQGEKWLAKVKSLRKSLIHRENSSSALATATEADLKKNTERNNEIEARKKANSILSMELKNELASLQETKDKLISRANPPLLKRR